MNHETYDPGHFSVLARAEDHHFWFVVRRRAIANVVRRWRRGRNAGERVLEAGCGTGAVLRDLQATCAGMTVIGMDLHREGLRFAAARNTGPFVQGDVLAVPFGPRFALVGLFDVLEHFPDDARVLESVKGVLQPGGHLVVTVPARPSLWSEFDVASHHVKRYSEASIRSALSRAGFDIEYVTHLLMATLPFVWVVRRLIDPFLARFGRAQRKRREVLSSQLSVSPVLNALLLGALWPEGLIVRRGGRLPFGSSLLVTARVRGAGEAPAGAA